LTYCQARETEIQRGHNRRVVHVIDPEAGPLVITRWMDDGAAGAVQAALDNEYSGPHVQDSFPPNLSYRAHVHRSGLALPQPQRSSR
jgi:hypothetical protein